MLQVILYGPEDIAGLVMTGVLLLNKRVITGILLQAILIVSVPEDMIFACSKPITMEISYGRKPMEE